MLIRLLQIGYVEFCSLERIESTNPQEKYGFAKQKQKGLKYDHLVLYGFALC